jgi:Skp family chaperone for outer membrane proteins
MKKLFALTLLSLFASGVAYAAANDPVNPQQDKMKACNTKAGDMKGDDRKAFMKTCLSAKPEKKESKMAMCNKKTAGMNKDDRAKAQSDCMKAA